MQRVFSQPNAVERHDTQRTRCAAFAGLKTLCTVHRELPFTSARFLADQLHELGFQERELESVQLGHGAKGSEKRIRTGHLAL